MRNDWAIYCESHLINVIISLILYINWKIFYLFSFALPTLPRRSSPFGFISETRRAILLFCSLLWLILMTPNKWIFRHRWTIFHIFAWTPDRIDVIKFEWFNALVVCVCECVIEWHSLYDCLHCCERLNSEHQCNVSHFSHNFGLFAIRFCFSFKFQFHQVIKHVCIKWRET